MAHCVHGQAADHLTAGQPQALPGPSSFSAPPGTLCWAEGCLKSRAGRRHTVAVCLEARDTGPCQRAPHTSCHLCLFCQDPAGQNAMSQSVQNKAGCGEATENQAHSVLHSTVYCGLCCHLSPLLLSAQWKEERTTTHMAAH